jgi:DNA-binding transcriptional LysR family regulator
MTSDNSLSLILRRLDEIERKLDRMLPDRDSGERRIGEDHVRPQIEQLLRRSRPRHHHVVYDATVAHHVSSRYDELLERSFDIVEKYIGDETIDACIDAGHIGQHLQIGEPSCVGGIGGIAADALEVIALEIEFLPLA